MIIVTKKKRETNFALLKRFNKKLQKSKNIQQFKAKQFRKRPSSDFKKKEAALARIKRQEHLERLYKLGKIDFQ
jgi:ribosomal protein S21